MNQSKPAKIFFVIGVVALLLTGSLAYLASHISWLWQVMAGIAVLSIAVSIFTGAKDLGTALSSRQAQYGINAIFMCFLGLGIVVVVNLISSRYDVKYDFSKNKNHTFSEQTIKVLTSLKSEVKIRVYVTPDQTAKFDRIVDKYTYYSRNLKKEFIDVDKEPFALQKYGIKQPGTLVVETADRSSKVDNIFGPDDPKLEEKITNAIISVTKGEKKKIYFLVGHGERSSADGSGEGFSELKGELESSRYKVEDLQLADKDKIPADAEIVIVAAPKSEWLDHETKLVESYVMGGGKLLFLIEPISPVMFQNFLAKFGAKWKAKRVIVETNPLQQYAGGNPLTPVVVSYSPSSEVTQSMKQNQVTIFAIASAIEKDPIAPPDMKLDTLFSTSTKSFESELVKDKLKIDQANDRKGPLGMALSSVGKVKSATPPPPVDKAKTPESTEKPADKEFRVIIVGDADFAGNTLIRKATNLDLVQNMLSWLAKEEDLISIRPKATDESKFEITEERFRIIHFASIWLLPPLLMMSGVGVWLSRRKK